MRLAEKLDQAIFTPSSKADVGKHDENISFIETKNIVGEELATQIKNTSIRLYDFASKHSIKRGIIIADTKFEFGLDNEGQLTLMDEVLTPDSSRFWPLQNYKPGLSPKSFDKQIIRDYLETLDWNKEPPAPIIPESIMAQTAQKYKAIQSKLCN